MEIITFILVFVGIVLVHELGHYVLAKVFGIQVLEFAIGFGPAIYRKRGRETTFRINAFPFGGYVRLAGENPYEEIEWEEGRGFYDKPAWQRLLVSLAGPAFSILAGYVIFMFVVGIWGVNLAGVSQVLPGTPAEEAGLKRGDLILKINDRYVFDQSVISGMIRRGDPLRLTIVRNGEKIALNITPYMMPRQADLDLQSATGTVGKRLVAFEGGELTEEVLKESVGSRVFVEFDSGKLEGVLKGYYYVPERYAIGFVFSGLSPTLREDFPPLKKGDEILSVNGQKVKGWLDFIRATRIVEMEEDEVYVELVGNEVDWWGWGSGSEIELTVRRDGKVMEFTLDKEVAKKLLLDPTNFEPEVKPYKPSSPIEGIDLAIQRCNWIVSLTWGAVFSKGFFGSIARGEVTGPVGIAWMVGKASKMGLDSVLVLSALITMSLGVFNLLPLPALDGGRIVFALIEILTRRKLDPKVEAMIHTIGFLFLIGLLLFITFMDIGRMMG